MTRPIAKVLVANRGEIACRVFRTARAMGIGTVAVHSDADASALHVRQADEAVRIGPAPAAESYLLGERVVEAARATGADAIHPGYGFLSENAGFAQSVIDAGLVWVGPPPEAIRAMGLKDAAKRLMEAAGVPLVPGYHGEAQDDATLRAEAGRIGAPLMIKAAAGGGGKGMRLVEDLGEFDAALESARREARSAFGNADVLIERFVTSPRHIEVQVIADAHGRTLAVGTRDCSLQRRHQKVIEEAPAPGLTPAIERAMLDAAVRAAEAVGYVSAGTVEFIADGAKLAEALAEGSDAVPGGAFSFMEMNTRLQVEHPVTEESVGRGLDLVEWQLRVARGEPLPDPFPREPHPASRREGRRHAMEARLYAEDPASGFLPATGTLHRLRLPLPDEGAEDDPTLYLSDGLVRTDTGVREGDAITPNYDPMIAKLIAAAPTREDALGLLRDALDMTEVAGLATNLSFLRRLLDDPDFAAARLDTGLIARGGEALTAEARPSVLAHGLAAMAAGGMLPRSPHAGFRLWGRARAYVPLGWRGEERTVCVVGPDDGGAFEVEVEADSATLRLDRVAWEAAASHANAAEVRTIEVALSTGEAERGGEGPVVATVRLDATVTLHPGDRAGARAVTVRLEGRSHAFTIPDPLARDAAAGGGDAVLAPMPGTLIALDVTPGDAVAAGQRVAVMEAMKMEQALKAPRDGTVASVGASVGRQVAAGDAVVVLETE